MFQFMNFVRPFVNYVIFRELCDRMRFEVDCAKSHHQVISEGLDIIGRVARHSFRKWNCRCDWLNPRKESGFNVSTRLFRGSIA